MPSALAETVAGAERLFICEGFVVKSRAFLNSYKRYLENKGSFYKDLPEDICSLLFMISSDPNSTISRVLIHQLSKHENLGELSKRAFLKSSFKFNDRSKISIYIRTYPKDVVWLPLLFDSIEKFAWGCEVIVCCAAHEYDSVHKYIPSWANVVCQEQFIDGSIHQKYSKLTADSYVSGEYIIYLDSDTVFINDLNASEWFWDEKPVLEYTSYNDIITWMRQHAPAAGSPAIWRSGVASALGRNIEHEFSRRIEKIYRTEWISEARNFIEDRFGCSFKNFIARQWGVKSATDPIGAKYFSDFNYLGAYLWEFKRNDVSWINTEYWDFWARPLSCVQFHSFSMIEGGGDNRKISSIPLNFLQSVKRIREKKMSRYDENNEIINLYTEFRRKHKY